MPPGFPLRKARAAAVLHFKASRMAVSHVWLACSLLLAACDSGGPDPAETRRFSSRNVERSHVYADGAWRESPAVEGSLVENRIDALPEAFRGVLELSPEGVDGIHTDGDSIAGRRLSAIRFPGSDVKIGWASGAGRLDLTYGGKVVVKKLDREGDSLCQEGYSIFWASEEGRTREDRSRCGTGAPAHAPTASPRDSVIRFDTARNFPVRADTIFLGSVFSRFNFPGGEGHTVEAASLAELKSKVEAGTEKYDSVRITERRDFFIEK